MRNIGITTFVTLLMLGMAVIGSGHVALARNFSNSGNYLVNDQNCTAGTCNLSSSNTVTGSSGLTSPSPTPTPTNLTLQIRPVVSGLSRLTGSLNTDTGPVVGAKITFTTSDGKPVGTRPMTVVTGNDGIYGAIASVSSGKTVTAHFAGTDTLAASDSPPAQAP
jgi:hypothetical protein